MVAADGGTGPALRLQGVTKSYGETLALRGVDVTIEAGQVLGLVGPNGAGKTTLISIASGLTRPDAGDVSVLWSRGRGPDDRVRAEIGLAPQALGIYPTLRVRDNLVLFGELSGLRRRALADRIDRVAEAMALTALLDRRAGTLSGGQKRRLHVGLALIHHPRLLLLDEPSTSLDARGTLELLELVRSLAAGGAAVCYSTNQLAEVEALGTSVAILDAGRIIANGTLAAILERYSAPAAVPIERGSLQSAFLALTGRPYRPDSAQEQDIHHAQAT